MALKKERIRQECLKEEIKNLPDPGFLCQTGSRKLRKKNPESGNQSYERNPKDRSSFMPDLSFKGIVCVGHEGRNLSSFILLFLVPRARPYARAVEKKKEKEG